MTGHLGLINQARKMATSTKRIIINTSAAPKAIGPYNQVSICDFKFTENSHSRAIFSISRNHVSLQFCVMSSHFSPIHIISAISCEISLKFGKFFTQNHDIWGKLSAVDFTLHANAEKWNHIHSQFTEILVTIHH